MWIAKEGPLCDGGPMLLAMLLPMLLPIVMGSAGRRWM
jgi:hypothetical protein